MSCSAPTRDESYRESVGPRAAVTRRLAAAAGARQGCWRYIGRKAADVFPHFGSTADNIVQQVRELLEGA
jgi:hypothetical protein